MRRQFIDAAARRALIAQRKREGATWAEIAAELDLTPDGLRVWWAYWGDAPIRPKAKPLLRPCLCCSGAFLSEGPHHRMCAPCRQRSESPYAPNPGTSTGRRVARHGKNA